MTSKAKAGVSLVSILVLIGLAVVVYHLTRILLASLGIMIVLIVVLYFVLRKA